MSPEYSKKLFAVRKNLNLTLDKVESMTGIPTSTIKDYEAGKLVNPNLTKISALCDCYGISLSSVLSESKGKSIFARAKEVLSGSEINNTLGQIKSFSEHHQNLISFLKPADLLDIRQAKMYPDNPSIDWDSLACEISEDIRETIGHRSEDPIDLISYLRSRRHIFFFSCELPEEIDGLFFSSDDNLLFTIVINSTKSAVRQNFTLAHEYAHFLLDREKTSYICKDVDTISTNDAIEDRANRVASHLLVPTAALAACFHTNNPAVTPEKIVELCSTFCVSYQVMVYRLHNEDLINANIRDELLRYDHLNDFQYRQFLNKMELRFNELRVYVNLEFDQDSLSDAEIRYINMVHQAYEKRKVSFSKVSEYLPSESLIRALNMEEPEIDIDDIF